MVQLWFTAQFVDGGSHPMVSWPHTNRRNKICQLLFLWEGRQVLYWSNWRTRIFKHCRACTCYNTTFSHDFPKPFKLSFWRCFLGWIWKLALQIWLALHIVPGTFQKIPYGSSAFWFSTSESKFDALCHCDPFYHKNQFLSRIFQKPVHIAGNKTPTFDPTNNS